jgi:hypothetical protein
MEKQEEVLSRLAVLENGLADRHATGLGRHKQAIELVVGHAIEQGQRFDDRPVEFQQGIPSPRRMSHRPKS